MKLRSDRGSGEAKFFVGPKSNQEEYDAFFEFDEGYKYSFNKENLLEYMKLVKVEYVFKR